MADPTKHTASAHRLFFPEDGIDLPFTVANRPGLVLISLAARAELHPVLVDPRAYNWVVGVPGRVVVDVSRILMMNSSCCGWLANLLRSAKPAVVVIEGATDQIAEVLRVLRLDVVMNVSKTQAPTGKHRRPSSDGGGVNPRRE